MKFQAINFQSLGNVTIEGRGLIAVTGKSNLGKSALVRAFIGVAFGYPGEAYVRRGCTHAAVGIKLDDGTTLEWKKVPSKQKRPGLETTVKINGEKRTKIGHDHYDLTAPLGFLQMDVGSSRVLTPQFARQFKKVFLLDESEATVAEVFKVFGRGDVVSKARDSAKKDLKEVQIKVAFNQTSTEKVREETKKRAWVRPLKQDVEGLLGQLKAMQELDQLLTTVRQIRPIAQIAPCPKDVVEETVRLLQLARSIKLFAVPTVPKDPVESIVMPLTLVTKLQAEVDRYQKNLDSVNQSLAASRFAIAELEKALGVCPTCGQTFEHTYEVQ